MPKSIDGWYDISDCDFEMNVSQVSGKYEYRTGAYLDIKINGVSWEKYGISKLVWDMSKFKDPAHDRGIIKVKIDDKYKKMDLPKGKKNPTQKIHYIGRSIEIESKDNIPRNTEVYCIGADKKTRVRVVSVMGFIFRTGDAETFNEVNLTIL